MQGGTAPTTNWGNTVGGGTAATTSWDDTIDGGTAKTTFYRFQSAISASSNAEVRFTQRTRNVEPETVWSNLDCGAYGVINTFIGRSAIGLVPNVNADLNRVRTTQAPIEASVEAEAQLQIVIGGASDIIVGSPTITDGGTATTADFEQAYNGGYAPTDTWADFLDGNDASFLLRAANVGAQLQIIREAAPDIQTVTSLESLAQTIKSALSGINTDIQIDIDYTRQRLTGANILGVISTDIQAQRVRVNESNIAIDLNLAPDEVRQRSVASDVSVVVETSADALRDKLAEAAIKLTTAASADNIRLRGVGADIEAQSAISAAGALLGFLLGYDSALEPGDTVEINTDQLTVEKDGTNMRKYFEGEWLKLDPNDTMDMIWSDGEVDRDVEIVIEKEDRSI